MVDTTSIVMMYCFDFVRYNYHQSPLNNYFSHCAVVACYNVHQVILRVPEGERVRGREIRGRDKKKRKEKENKIMLFLIVQCSPYCTIRMIKISAQHSSSTPWGKGRQGGF